jgi:hypothetical protein
MTASSSKIRFHSSARDVIARNARPHLNDGGRCPKTTIERTASMILWLASGESIEACHFHARSVHDGRLFRSGIVT